MSALPGRTGPGAMPGLASLSWGDVTATLARVSASARSAAYDSWQAVAGMALPKATPSDRSGISGRFGDPVVQRDSRTEPLVQGPEPHALDSTGGNRENRAGMPDSARAIGFGGIGALAVIVGVLLFSRR